MNSKRLAEARTSGKRGNCAQKARVLIEGSYFTYAEISARTGRPDKQCQSRYGHMKRKGEWPITWEMLK